MLQIRQVSILSCHDLFSCKIFQELIVGFSIEEINNLKKQLLKQFAMKDLRVAKKILGIGIIKDNGTLKLSQLEYVKKVLNRFNMNET